MPTNPTFLDRAGAVAGRLDNALRLGGIRFVKDTANGGWPAFVLARSREDDDYFRAPTVAVKAPRGRVRIYVTYEGRNNEQREREIDPLTDPTAVPEIVTRLREMGALIRIDGRELGEALEGKLGAEPSVKAAPTLRIRLSKADRETVERAIKVTNARVPGSPVLAEEWARTALLRVANEILDGAGRRAGGR